MEASEAQTGRCLCGKVRFRISGPPSEVVACHCSMCRRWSGGVLLTVDSDNRQVTFEGEEHIARYRSSDWAERAFCRHCGSGLFWRQVEKGPYIISAGLLDEPAPLSLEKEFFIDEKPDYYAFANDTEKLTGEEVFAKFMPEEKEA